MEIGAYGIALIGVGGTILGTLLGVLITYRLSIKLAKINDRREANRRLVAAFCRELADVYPTPVSWPENIDNYLRSKFSVLQAAVGKFRHYLPNQEWEAFDRAWFNYYCSTGREVDKKCQSYLHYMNFITTTSDQKTTKRNGQQNLKDNVDHILNFANSIKAMNSDA